MYFCDNLHKLPMNNYIFNSIDDFDYNLPDSNIAKFPLQHRDASKLLLFADGSIQESVYSRAADFLHEQSLIVFNNTKVIEARFELQKATGARIEIFCLEPHIPHSYEDNFISSASCQWVCIVGNSKKWKDELLRCTFMHQGTEHNFQARKVQKISNTYIVEFSWTGGMDFSAVMQAVGNIPIPPYLHRKSEPSDAIQYQTIYASPRGSVAAPTAGLHFTQQVLDALQAKRIEQSFVTLHVGAGTFKPVSEPNFKDHIMHREFFTVAKDEVAAFITQGSRAIIAVGTTTVRTLESLYWVGVKLLEHKDKPFEISQWEAYELPSDYSRSEAFGAVLRYMEENGTTSISAHTTIMIVPGYSWRVVDAMFTNFHQPKSTLLLLVSAFVGSRWKDIYTYALAHNYRFLSYGDGMLLKR